MKKLNISLSPIFYCILLILLCCSCSNSVQHNNNPSIAIIYVPSFGSMDNLKGKTENIIPSNYGVIVYIRVSGVWWTKPTSNNPITEINKDGTWECDITTGGIDEQATEITAYLISKKYIPPVMNGSSELPPELETNSIEKVVKVREPKYREINFSGYDWIVKFSSILVGPGPNYFTDSEELAYKDDSGKVHLKIKEYKGKWQCSEIICSENFGYGTYIFYVTGKIDQGHV